MSEYYNAFISYGRADSKYFATKLYEKLTEKGLKIWFDQNDIPLGVDFQNQIDDGITKAANFLFIIAPHSVNSPYCLKEIELAVKYNKRIIPLLHVEQITYEIWQQRNPQKTLEAWEIYQQKGLHSSFPNMHPEIGRINWVYFQENINDFDKSLTDLIKIFDKHQDYVKQHTNILVKALDWENNQKQTRYLLTGKERQQAEQWLKTKFTDEQPPCIPTDLHCEFICESEKNSNNLMTQVFLAFAEADKNIMQQIRKSLIREGITVWSSHADIKTGKDFQIEINQGIAGADNLIFLLSPEAIKSEYCQQELTYALSLNKRIIPILISATDLTEIPTEIRYLQFIDFTTESYQEAIDKLLKEIQIESVYYQRHKNLLVKALKWLSQNRNPSILLRGYNLEQYQSWLELARNRTVNLPTDLQREFIAESTKQPPNLVLDVFVSYSRANSDFARRLNDALQTQGKTTWFDQESIATGTDFQQEIKRGIEQSDNFLFIISPESVNSPYCADEVEYAKSLNKRFVTVLHRKVDTAELHPELAKVQWLDFNRYGGDFYANFSELVRTLDTDREYVREHTQMSQKALEWEKGNKNVDLLFRGSECNRAYEWLQLAQKYNKQPAVTEEIKEFILKSKELLDKERKKKQWQRQRTIIGMAAFSLIISLLAVRSEMQRRKAVSSERKAEMRELQTRIVSGERTLDLQLAALKLEKQTNGSTAKIQTIDILQQTVDWQGYKEINSLEGHKSWVYSVALSNKGDLIASASRDNTVKLWKADGTLVRTLTGHENDVWGVAFSHKGDLIASASRDNTVKLWKLDGSLVRTLTGHKNSVIDVAFSPKGDLIASASRDNTVKLWKADGTLVRTLTGHENDVWGVAFSPKGDLIASASIDNTVKLWKPDGTLVRTLTGHENSVYGVAFSPKGDLIASASTDNTVKLWKPDGTLVRTLTGHENSVIDVAFSPKGDLIASASLDNTVKLWKPDATLVRTLTGHENSVEAVAFSPKGDLIASASRDNTVKLWQPDGTLVRTLTGHESWVRGVAISPKGDLIASASGDKTVKLWKPDGTLVRTLTGHENSVYGVAFSPKGDLIASASSDNTVKLWKVDGTLVRTLTGHENSVIGVAFSPKGDLIASASWDNTVKLWKADGTSVRTLTGHENSVIGVAFSPKGDLIASASIEGIVKLWKADGTLVRTLIGHENSVIGVAFSPKGGLIASASSDKTVKLWRFNQDDLMAHACQWMTDYLKNNPNVTEEERHLCGVSASATALFLQGEKLAAEGKVESAISAFQKAVKLGSNFPFNSAIAKELAQEDKVKAAEKLLGAFIELDHNIDLLPETEAIDQNPALVVRQFQAEGKVKEAVQLIKDRKIEEAISKFKEAQKLQSDIDLNSDTKEIETDAEAVAKKLAAPGKVEEGKYLAKDGKIAEAVSVFEEAQKLQSDIDLNSDTEEIETDAEAVAQKFAAPGKVQRGKTLAQQGEIDKAINLFNEAQKLDSELEITGRDWNSICWNGSLYNRAKDVMFACEKAVKLAPEDGGIIDSRGLARALTGDFAGAIKDFEVFIKWTDNAEEKAQRQGWVDALKKGENPFTEEVLEELR